MASISRWDLDDANQLARTLGPYLPDPLHSTIEQFVSAAELAASRHPDEWVLFYQLADKYQSLGLFSRSLQAAKRCMDLRPADIRSAYALATAYNILTRAEWAGIEGDISKLLPILLAPYDPSFDPSRSNTEIEEMGMVLDTAAAQAIRWFEMALQLSPDAASATQIARDLATLYERFPHLRL
jgi:tetratricopeptide (TPR) repeat protein